MALLLNFENSEIAWVQSSGLSAVLYLDWIKFFNGLTISTSLGFFRGTDKSSAILNTPKGTVYTQQTLSDIFYVREIDKSSNKTKRIKKISICRWSQLHSELEIWRLAVKCLSLIALTINLTLALKVTRFYRNITKMTKMTIFGAIFWIFSATEYTDCPRKNWT